MYDVDAIEAINFEQLVTVTDRLLLRGGRVPRRRPSTIHATADVVERTVVVARPARDAIDLTVVLGSAIVTTLLFIAAFA